MTERMSLPVIWVGANAGGVGKTTLIVNLGYELAQRGFKVLAVDLDTNESMMQFSGLRADIPPQKTTAAIFHSSFLGQYPIFSPMWGTSKGGLDLCLGGPIMADAEKELSGRPRREYLLADIFQDYPLQHDLILLDSSASLGLLSEIAYAASTHVLISSEVSPKGFKGADSMLTWLRERNRLLRLSPQPKILGFVPNQYDDNEAMQRGLIESLPKVLARQNVHCYQPIRYSSEFKNASRQGIPLKKYRPGHKAWKSLITIADDLEDLIRGKE